VKRQVPAGTTFAACTDRNAGGRCKEPAFVACQWPLKGKKAGTVCGLAVCVHHAHGSRDVPLCGPHGRLLGKIEGQRAA
jgi:hypothetical protein